MLLIFTRKRFFEWSEADLLSISTLSDLMMLAVGVRKRISTQKNLYLKLVFVIFYQILIFSPDDFPFENYEKCSSKMQLVPTFRPLLFLITLPIKRDWIWKKVTF